MKVAFFEVMLVVALASGVFSSAFAESSPGNPDPDVAVKTNAAAVEKRVRLLSDAREPVLVRDVVKMLVDQGVDISAPMPLDGYSLAVLGIHDASLDASLSSVLWSAGLDYDRDRSSGKVIIRPLSTRHWNLSPDGSGAQAGEDATWFWEEIERRLSARAEVTMPGVAALSSDVPEYYKAGRVVAPPLSADFTLAANDAGANVAPPAVEFFARKKVATFSIDRLKGTVSVQGPKQVLARVNLALQQVVVRPSKVVPSAPAIPEMRATASQPAVDQVQAPSPVATAISSTTRLSAPAPKVQSRWVVEKGEAIHVVLESWAAKSGWTLLWYPSHSWKAISRVTIDAEKDVVAAVSEVITTLREEEGKQIKLKVSDGNSVMEVVSTEVKND